MTLRIHWSSLHNCMGRTVSSDPHCCKMVRTVSSDPHCCKMGRMGSSDPHCCKMSGHWFHVHPRKPASDCSWEKFSWGVVLGIRLEGWGEFVIGCNSQRGEQLFNKKKKPHTHKNLKKKYIIYFS